MTKRTIVRWQEFNPTWQHPIGSVYGYWDRRERAFESADEARGFAEGMKRNRDARDVEVGW